MTPTEALICQKFPVLPHVHNPAAMLTSFNAPNPHRNARHVCKQVGNSMHCGVMSLLQLHSLAEVRRPAIPSLFANIRLARTD